jgi:hypothetical protein
VILYRDSNFSHFCIVGSKFWPFLHEGQHRWPHFDQILAIFEQILGIFVGKMLTFHTNFHINFCLFKQKWPKFGKIWPKLFVQNGKFPTFMLEAMLLYKNWLKLAGQNGEFPPMLLFKYNFIMENTFINSYLLTPFCMLTSS